MSDFERWLEPLLAPGEELSLLAEWANERLGRSPDCGDGVGLAPWRVKLWKLTADMFYL